MGAYSHRAVETDILEYVAEALADPMGRFSIALLTGSPHHDIDAVLVQGVVPRFIERTRDPAHHPVQLRGAWADSDVAASVHFCVSESDVPAAPPGPGAPVRMLLVACTDVEALPDWVTDEHAIPVRTLPIGPLSLFEAHDVIEAELGEPVDPESVRTLASLAGFTPVPLATVVRACRSSGVLERLNGTWSLIGDPVQVAMVPYLRAQLASADPAYARIMFRLALIEPFSLGDLAHEEVEIVDQLLRDGELHHRTDGRVEFVAAAGSSALRSVAPLDEQHRVQSAALQKGEPTFPSILWAVQHGHPLISQHLEHVATTAISERNWQVVVEIAELTEISDRVSLEGVAAFTRSQLHVQAAAALRFLPDTDRAYGHLEQAEDLLHDLSADEATEVRAHIRTVRAELLHYHEGDLDAALGALTADTEVGVDAQVLSHLFSHQVYGGGHAEAQHMLQTERRVLGRAVRHLRERVAVAEVLLTAAAGQPGRALRKVTQLAARRGGAPEYLSSLREELGTATVIAALACDGPENFPQLERKLGDVEGAAYGIDLTNMYFMRGSWEYAHGNIAAAHRFGLFALDAAENVDPRGLAAAACSLVAETSALLGDHAAATRCIDRGAALPLKASAVISGTVRGHLSAAQLLVDTPQAGESLRRSAAFFVEQKQFGFASDILYQGIRFGRRRAAQDLLRIADQLDGNLHRMRVEQATALLTDDPVVLFRVAEQLQAVGLRLYATEVAAMVLRFPAVPGSLQNRAASLLATYLSEHTLTGHTLLRLSQESVGGTRLTPRERDVSELIDSGLSNAEIAHRLNLSLATVEGHITRIYRKTGGSRRAPARRAPSRG